MLRSSRISLEGLPCIKPIWGESALCTLTLSEDSVDPRFIESRGEAWKSYVMANHSTVTEIFHNFLESQEKLRRYTKQSLIPTSEINTDEEYWESYAKRILMD